MKRLLLTVTALSQALLLAACAVEVGYDARSEEYGNANAINFVAQDAYNSADLRLQNLAVDFAASAQDTVTFAFNRSELDENARKALDGQAKWLKDHPNVKMTIIGHTDLVGTKRYNKSLGLRRARSVVRYLSRKGVSRRRLAAVASRGETEPVVQTEARERRNRRAVTTVSGFARRYVGDGIDGVYAARVYDVYQSGTFQVDSADSENSN